MSESRAWCAAGMLLAALLLAQGCDTTEEPAAAPEPRPTPRLSEAQIEEARKVVDVEGVPPLFPEGRQHPANPISLHAYFERFGTSQLIDVETRMPRPALLESLEQELVGKQVTWDGYVDRVRPLPSGRATLVITPAPEKPGLDVAMVKFPAGDTEELLGYAKGDRVRVVAVFDKLSSFIPSLRGLRVEKIAEAGLISSE